MQTSTTLRNDLEKTVDTLQSSIRATSITTIQKQRISALTGGQGGRGGRGGGGRNCGGNHYQIKHTYMGVIGGRGGNGGPGGHGVSGSSDRSVRFNNQRNPLQGIDWVEDKFYEPGFYAKFAEEQKSRLHELRNSRSATPPATQKLASVESRLLQLEQIASTTPPPQPVVASLQVVSQVGVQPQYTNDTNPALQRLNHIS